MDLIETNTNFLLISVPTRFIRDWITSRYLDTVIEVIKSHNKNINRIEFKINTLSNEIDKSEQSLDKEESNVTFIKDSFIQYNRIDPNKNFENFVVGLSNSLAYEASKKITDNISVILYICIQVSVWVKLIY